MNSTSENSTTSDNPNATNETNMSTRIIEVVSAQFFDKSPSGTVHIQVDIISSCVYSVCSYLCSISTVNLLMG